MNFESDRRFQVWDYHVSHARMLIRSPSGAQSPTNIDIIFFGIKYIGIPSTFLGLRIDTISVDETLQLGLTRDEHDDSSTTFRLESEGRFYYIMALACRVFENELDLFDSSLENPCEDRPRSDPGQVIAHF